MVKGYFSLKILSYFLCISDKNLSIEFALSNNIVKNKHKTKELLLNTIKGVINDNDYQKSINEIENNKKVLQDKLLKLVDMRLDNSITKEVYDLKEEEIKTKLSNLDEELKELQKLNEDNKNISTKIKEIEKITKSHGLMFKCLCKKIIK